ncbi:glutathione S-transferase family protein [Sphingomonas sp. SUN019]|uniref:glutathione S-transferase family protein n=1 Tax=Sphingomonas sp. SUN019 TaxID=2937788 RepID=UPI002164972C|nr:glutathione S-transferase family protein [Sphingomonas sp. SUN019]UVO51997.1 glutathione S-transferase family protein [Sphingomonas sp. SUN019]
MTLFLWETPLSPFVEKVKLALREKGLPFEGRIPGGIGVGVSAELVVANPRSEAPALVDGDVTIFDSSIILDYIEDKWSDPPLRAATAAGRARARMIEEVCDTHYEAINWGLYELNFFRRGQAQGIAGELLAAARADTAILHDWLERQLGEDDWFGGAAFGMADIAVVPFVAGSALHGIRLDQGRPLGRWYARMFERPCVAETFAQSHGDLSLINSVADVLDQGLLKRHYRDHRLEWMIRAGGLSVVTDGLAADNVRFTDLSRLQDQSRLAR